MIWSKCRIIEFVRTTAQIGRYSRSTLQKGYQKCPRPNSDIWEGHIEAKQRGIRGHGLGGLQLINASPASFNYCILNKELYIQGRKGQKLWHSMLAAALCIMGSMHDAWKQTVTLTQGCIQPDLVPCFTLLALTEAHESITRHRPRNSAQRQPYMVDQCIHYVLVMRACTYWSEWSLWEDWVMINLWLMACILFLYPVWRFMMMMMMMMMTIFVHIASSHSDIW